MIRTALLAIVMTTLAACAGNPPQNVRLYQLSTGLAPVTSQSIAQSIGIGPLKWPEYLNRRALITRLDAGSIEAAENDRWAEPLDSNFERVLRDNLARQINPQRLQSHPWSLNDTPAVQVPIEVLQFDTSTQGEAVLRARWRIVARDRKELLAEHSSEIRVKAKDGSAASAVAAQSEALARLSEEIGRGLVGK